MTDTMVEVRGRKVALIEQGRGEPLVYLHGFADVHGVAGDFQPFHLRAQMRNDAAINPGTLLAAYRQAFAGSPVRMVFDDDDRTAVARFQQTHGLPATAFIADEILVMHQGNIVVEDQHIFGDGVNVAAGLRP